MLQKYPRKVKPLSRVYGRHRRQTRQTTDGFAMPLCRVYTSATSCAKQVARNLRATCCLKQHVTRNTQLVAGNKQLAARNMMLVARNKLRVARNLLNATSCADVNAALAKHNVVTFS